MSQLLKNRYQIFQVFEAGGFGQTFLAVDTDTPSRRKCIIKKLKPLTEAERAKFDSEAEVLEHIKFVQDRFDREAAILERLGKSSNQIPELYAYFVENQEFYLVQEFIDGLTLRKKLRREGVFDENTVRDLLWSLLNVLEYVHSQNIIHRDIQPNNIILREQDNKPVLIDFGIVKEVLRVGTDGSPTSSALAGGAPGYTAIEQAAGRPIYASDLYSLGATAIYLLTGKNPQQMINPATEDIVWRHFAPQVSGNFAAVINKATKTYARDRYKTAAEMREDLQKLLRGEPTQQQPLKQEQRKSNFALYFGIAAFLGLSVLIGALALLNSFNNSSREADNRQNINTNRSANIATTQNMNLSNTNSAVSNSNIPINANVSAQQRNETPAATPTPVVENTGDSKKLANSPNAEIVQDPDPKLQPLTEGKVRNLLGAWVRAQNTRNFANYKACYDSSFEGVQSYLSGTSQKRNYEQWMVDRGKMLNNAVNLKVEIANLQIRVEGDTAIAEFDQYYRSLSYSDWGPKEIQVKMTPSGAKIVYEELKRSYPLAPN